MGVGMPSVLSCVYAVKEYLDAPPSDTEQTVTSPLGGVIGTEANAIESVPMDDNSDAHAIHVIIKSSSPEEILRCNMEG
jgi:hypothetical protein